MKPHRHESRLRPLLAAAAVALVAGCSILPTKPVTVNHEATSARVIESPTTEATPIDTTKSDTIQVAPITDTESIVGLVGGSAAAGHFKVSVPPTAFLGVADVTVRVPYPNAFQVDLAISPDDKNQFQTPVVLSMDLSQTLPDYLVAQCVVQWWNPDMQTWQPVNGSTVDMTTLSVSAPLHHFSTYRVTVQGRASW